MSVRRSSHRPIRNLAVTGTPYGWAARHRRAHDRPQQPRLGRHRSAAAAPGHLGRRAAEVEVDVVDEALVAHQVHGPPEHVGIAAVDLQAARPLVGAEAHHPQRLVVAVDDGRAPSPSR